MNEKDVYQLLCLLWNHSNKWNTIGLALGFLPSELNTISAMPNLLVGSPQSCLQELLTRWVQWPTNNYRSEPTLEALCKALRSAPVGLGSLADTVYQEMIQNTGKSAVKKHCMITSKTK